VNAASEPPTWLTHELIARRLNWPQTRKPTGIQAEIRIFRFGPPFSTGAVENSFP
jgi:hypothetical protein